MNTYNQGRSEGGVGAPGARNEDVKLEKNNNAFSC